MNRRYHAAALTHPFVRLIGAAALFMTAVLLLDGPGLARQLALSAATASFLWLFVRRLNLDLVPVLCAIGVATVGEVILSLGWGLYSYQHALIPLYVPPGHGLFYALAAATARQEWFRARESVITRCVLIAGSVNAAVTLVLFGDAWGLLWWCGALALIRVSRNQLLLASCFVFTLVLEWFGTANGNWAWAAEVPLVGLRSANPPSGVGILYILLDLVVVWLTAGGRASRSLAPAVPPVAYELAAPASPRRRDSLSSPLA